MPASTECSYLDRRLRLLANCHICKRPLPWNMEEVTVYSLAGKQRFIRHRKDNTTETIIIWNGFYHICTDCRKAALPGHFTWPDNVEFPAAWYIENLDPRPNDKQLPGIVLFARKIADLTNSKLITLDHAKETVSYLRKKTVKRKKPPKGLLFTDEENGVSITCKWRTAYEAKAQLRDSLLNATSTLESNAIHYARLLEILGERFDDEEWEKVKRLEIPATHSWYETWNVVAKR